MNFSRFNIATIFLVFVLTLGLLLGGRWAYQEFGVMKPLKKSLADAPIIKETVIKNEGTKLTIELELGEVQSLYESVREIEELLPQKGSFNLVIKDQRNDYLKSLWSQSRFPLEEAAALGNLTEMREQLKKNLGEAKLDRWLLEVDGDNLYLQMHADNAYLYEIVPRHGSLFSIVEGKASDVGRR